jgi:tRNA dimethylallyltransferase
MALISEQLPTNRVVSIAGTNASGKSDLAVRIARRFSGEVVSADSRQVYRGLELGTGKLPLAERAGIPHHLLDLVDVGQAFSLAAYQRLAYSAIQDIISRGKLPFMVGGTGLYIQAVIDGYQLVDVPPDPKLRAELSAKSTDELAHVLKAVNPETASRIELHNKRRIIRALEIHYGGFEYSSTRRQAPRYYSLQLGLTWPWEILGDRIDRRLRMRIDMGMVDEVRELVRSGTPIRAIDELGLEYRHVLRYLTGVYQTETELFENLRVAIRKFARRQMSWFRRDRRILWLDTQGDYCAQAEERISKWLGGTENDR